MKPTFGAEVVLHGLLQPRAGQGEQGPALAESRDGVVAGHPVGTRGEVPLLAPVGDLLGCLQRRLVGPGTALAADQFVDRGSTGQCRLDDAEQVDSRALVEVAEGHRQDALGLGGRHRGVQVRQRLWRLQPQRGQQLPVVVDADHLTGLGHAEQRVALPGLAVAAEAVLLEQRLRVVAVPAVELGVVVHRAQHPGGDEGTHVGIALVGLDDVGRGVARQGQLQGGLQVAERLHGPLDGDVRILLVELGVQLVLGLGDAAVGVLVPDGQRHRAGGRDVLGRLVGRRRRPPCRRKALGRRQTATAPRRPRRRRRRVGTVGFSS